MATCKKCGDTSLKWIQVDGRWVLHCMYNQTVHNCNPTQVKTLAESLLAVRENKDNSNPFFGVRLTNEYLVSDDFHNDFPDVNV